MVGNRVVCKLETDTALRLRATTRRQLDHLQIAGADGPAGWCGGLVDLINRLNATTRPCKTDGTGDPPRKRLAAPTANKCQISALSNPTLTIIGNQDG